LFAPVAAMLARGKRTKARLRKSNLGVGFGPGDLAEIIYADHFGNLVTGLRASNVPANRSLLINGRAIRHARVYSEVKPGEVFWYENSLGLVELASNAASARQVLGLLIGAPVGLAGRA
jgi:S-adenosylmethionine hydrolase